MTMTPETIIARLEEAGGTRLSLSGSALPPPAPEPERIARMAEAFAWLGLIPRDRPVVRLLVCTRSFVSPITGKHLYPWRHLGRIVGADHKAVQRWHGEGIRLIVRALTPDTGQLVSSSFTIR